MPLYYGQPLAKIKEPAYRASQCNDDAT